MRLLVFEVQGVFWLEDRRGNGASTHWGGEGGPLWPQLPLAPTSQEERETVRPVRARSPVSISGSVNSPTPLSPTSCPGRKRVS